ncbi:transcriptional regulator, ArsR family [Ferroglobus placidus DSM 10642]|uniref:Transcriptional regulator, ArsR family n=1 Tax=Ferroglobus placidus (strain DSM 10642 / AEDII12DO) TaxID=589924 RepID=D3RX86_FERPA|nr:winged helix-turn-helix domain-containing protein [Ferroglobus placidus]ADC65099.1 transcriptional regulator, ArsR family [Ferroglobus placidus DSM 10642]
MGVRIALDRKVLFLLSSETRIEILKKLDERRMTLSELSRALNLSKTTVKEHLNKLLEAGLVRRVEEGRKWIYYELTPEGRIILHPEKVPMKTILSTLLAVASMLVGVYELLRFKAYKVEKAFDVAVKKVPTPLPEKAPVPAPAKAPTPMPVPTKTPTPVAIPSPTPVTPRPEIAKKVPAITEAAKPLVGIDFHFYLGLALIFVGVALIVYVAIKLR